MPKHMQQAVLAIEDRSFYSHPGVNPLRLAAVAVRSAIGSESLGGTSTITQQLSRMFFLADEFNAELQSGERGRTWGSYLRKAREGLMSLVLERKASKDEILELYLNDVYLGQRGSFAIHGVAEASRIFFGKDVANVSISEAAVIAGVIQSPASRSPFANPKRSTERRNVVLRAMADEGYITEDDATKAMREPLVVAARGVDNEAPYFVDMISQQVSELFPRVLAESPSVEVYTTLDLSLQRAALDAMRSGLARVDKQLAGRRRSRGRIAQSALIAIDPKTGEILALVGGRSYNQSQYNRVTTSRRQPGSVFKPFVFLAAFDYAAREGRTDLTPATADARRAHGPRNRHRRAVGAEELRRRIRRRDHVAPRAGDVAQRRHRARRRSRGLQHHLVVLAARRRGPAAARLPVDHARRLRADAVRSGHRLHHLHQRRRGAAAARHRARGRRRQITGARRRRRSSR